jgi:hypothetical protein
VPLDVGVAPMTKVLHLSYANHQSKTHDHRD